MDKIFEKKTENAQKRIGEIEKAKSIIATFQKKTEDAREAVRQSKQGGTPEEIKKKTADFIKSRDIEMAERTKLAQGGSEYLPEDDQDKTYIHLEQEIERWDNHHNKISNSVIRRYNWHEAENALINLPLLGWRVRKIWDGQIYTVGRKI